MAQKIALIPTERIENKILLIRDQKVIIDAGLAELYGVTKTVKSAGKKEQ